LWIRKYIYGVLRSNDVKDKNKAKKPSCFLEAMRGYANELFYPRNWMDIKL
jgi:hypothetical protein